MKNMNRLAFLIALVLLFCGCKSLFIDVSEPTSPGEEPATVREAPPGPYSHLQQRKSFSPKSDVQLKEACYVGDFVLGRVQLEVSGVGIDKTVIHGNLVVKTQCRVSNLTVTGNVIFEGNQARLKDVDFHGEIIDKGVQNQY
jgi:hypothetical protein